MVLMLSNLLLMPLAVASVSSEAALRNEFLQAERQVGSLQYEPAQKLLQKFADYPLQPYLQQRRLQQQLTADHYIAEFLQQYQQTPMDWPLRKPWLLDLARRQKGQTYLAHYPGSSDAELECHALRFQLAVAEADQAKLWLQVTKLWVVGKSQPKACDLLFSAWRKAGGQTPDIVWQRIRLAAEGGDAGLIPYLKTQIAEAFTPETQRAIVREYLQMRIAVPHWHWPESRHGQSRRGAVA